MIKYVSNDQKITVTDILMSNIVTTYIAVLLGKQINLIEYKSLKASGLASVKLEYNEFEAQLQELEARNPCNRPQLILLHCILAMYCSAVHCTELYCAALHCTTLNCTPLHCTRLKCNAPKFTNALVQGKRLKEAAEAT